MRVIRVKDGLVREVADTGSASLEEWAARFHPGVGEWVQHDTAEPRWSWDGATATPPSPIAPEVRRRNLHYYLAREGKRRRLALVGRTPNDPDTESAEMMLQVEQAMLQNKRETGRTNANENARLDDELEPLAVQMLAEWQAQQSIKPKIDSDEYTAENQIDNAAEWP